MAPPIAKPIHQEADPWHKLAPFVWGLVALHVFALLYWIILVLFSNRKAKPAAKQH